MKYKLLITLLVLSFNISYAQQARIQKHFPKFEDKIDAALFTCNEEGRPQGTGVSEIEIINDSILRIVNHTPSPSLGGIKIVMLLDSSLKVINITYSEWGDVMGAYERTFSTESPCVLLSFNPFKRGTEGLQGRYNFILKSDFKPGERLAKEGEIPSTDYRIFNGRFKCD